MRTGHHDVLDGLLTGLILAGLLTAPCLLQGRPVNACGEVVFLAGAGLAVASLPFAWVQSHSPPGILGLAARLLALPAPTAEADRERNWLDRVVSPHNVWLIAGGMMVAVSFMPPFLGTSA